MDKSHILSLSVAVVGAVWFLVHHLYNSLWFRSERLRRKLWMQGIKGPSPSLIYGNLPEMQKIQSNALTSTPNNADIVAHDYTSSLFPYFVQWRKQYGTTLPLFSLFPFSFFFMFASAPLQLPHMDHFWVNFVNQPRRGTEAWILWGYITLQSHMTTFFFSKS